MAKSTTGSGNTPAAKSTTPLKGWASAPLTIRRAVRLMLAGAVATFVWGLYWAIVTLGFRSDTVTYYVKVGHLTVNQANSQVNSGVLWIVIQVVVFAALWVLMARLNRDGHIWARIISTVLFLGWSYRTYSAIYELRQYIGLGDLIIQLAVWGIGCAALVSLWRPESTAYFRGTTPEAPKSAPVTSPKSAPVTRKRRLPARSRRDVTVQQPGNTSRKPPSRSARLTYEARRKRGAGPLRDLTSSP
jgi:hypothetical protein